jgi:hypothetical protein
MLDDLGTTLGAEAERAEALPQFHGSRSMAQAEADEALHGIAVNSTRAVEARGGVLDLVALSGPTHVSP